MQLQGQHSKMFVCGGQTGVWLIFLPLSDTVANEVYVFCEFTVTQVSSKFLWILCVSFYLTMSHACLFMCVIIFVASYAFVTVGEHVSIYELIPNN